MYFTPKAIADLRAEVQTVPQKLATLQALYQSRAYADERSKEFANQGYVRRLNILARCIDNVFDLIPPEQTEPPGWDLRHDAEIQIQTSVFNVFGAADNLAWIWVLEKAVRRPDGTALPDNWVGFRKGNTAVRDALPTALRTYLAGMDSWFDGLDNYRHALAHRIPLYIPPYVVTFANEEAYKALEAKKIQALFSGRLDEHERLGFELKKMEMFRPWMQHSFHEQAKPMVFHPQLLANFNTIEEMGRKVLEELDE